jgi:leucine-rich repeat/coiled-coil domain-containing protein 1
MSEPKLPPPPPQTRAVLGWRGQACSPEAFDKLSAENLGLKRAATERDMYREQMEDARRRWQDAERRVTELQVRRASHV